MIISTGFCFCTTNDVARKVMRCNSNDVLPERDGTVLSGWTVDIQARRISTVETVTDQAVILLHVGLFTLSTDI